MAYTDLNICTQAMLKLGAGSIQSFDENTREATIAGNLYNTIRDSELSGYAWNFAVKTQELARLNVTLTFKKFNYAYQLPSNMLRAIAGVSEYDNPVYGEIAEDRYYTDSERVFLRYIQEVTEADFPVFFVEALIARLCWEWAEPMTASNTLTERFREEYTIKMNRARHHDAQANMPMTLIDVGNSSILRARFG